jgi:hypothetical protein
LSVSNTPKQVEKLNPEIAAESGRLTNKDTYRNYEIFILETLLDAQGLYTILVMRDQIVLSSLVW